MMAGAVDARLGELDRLDRDALAARWVVAFGCPAPPRSRAEFLRRALAWQIQVAAAGGPDRRLQRRLERLARGSEQPVASPKLKPGVRLVRVWQGVTHSVLVTASGFEHQGKCYNSLSAVARAITGGSWSGPRFFGLKDKSGRCESLASVATATAARVPGRQPAAPDARISFRAQP